MKIAMLIVTYNRIDCLKKVLESAIKIYPLILEIYIINNASTDNTKEYLKVVEDESRGVIRVLNLTTNMGGAGGFAIGTEVFYKNSSCEWLWMMDDDVLPTKECLQAILSSIDEIGIYQPIRKSFEGDYYLQNILSRKSLRKNYFIPITKEDINKKEKIKISNIPFEGPLVHKSIFSKVGFPNPKYFLLYDDTDFSMRVLKNKFPIYLVTTAKLQRLLPTPLATENALRQYLSVRNRLIFEMEYMSILWKIIYIPYDTLRGILSLMKKKKYKNVKLLIIATFDALLDKTDRNLDIYK